MRNKVVLAAILLGLLVVLPACGKGPIKTEGVVGVVTLDGAPLKDATVRFIPTDANGLQSYGKTDEKGEYKLQTLTGAADAGTVPGKYLVAVDCVELYETGKTFEENGESKPEMKTRSLIPDYYSDETKSGLEADVVAGANVFNFDLTSK